MKSLIIPVTIEQKIFLVRGQKVMLDRDLAGLYGISTTNLNRAVTRNLIRFPEDFMFILNKEEYSNLMFQNGTSSWGGHRKPPRAFTEHGILMLSSVLKSERAVLVNIQIMRTFVKLRQMLSGHQDLLTKIEALEKKYDRQLVVVFDAIRQLMAPPEKPEPKIGFF